MLTLKRACVVLNQDKEATEKMEAERIAKLNIEQQEKDRMIERMNSQEQVYFKFVYSMSWFSNNMCWFLWCGPNKAHQNLVWHFYGTKTFMLFQDRQKAEEKRQREEFERQEKERLQVKFKMR